MLEDGEAAPGFELRNQDGDQISLSEFEGQRVVLYFFPRAGTEGCTVEARGFRDLHEEFAERDVVVLGISDDDPEDLRAFADDEDIPFDLLSDPNGEVATLYDAYGEKSMFGETFDGVYRLTYVVDPEGRIERAYDDVDPESHAMDVLGDLGAATAER